MYKIVLTKQAAKDYVKLRSAHLLPKAKALLDLVAQDPYQTPPPCEKLLGDLSGSYSRRINIQHRLVYSVDEASKTVHVLRLWSHYD